MASTVEEMLSRIAAARYKRKLSQRAAAKQIGISQAYLGGLETKANAPPAWEVLARICEAYEIDANWVLGITNGQLEAAPEEQTLIALIGRLSPKRQRDLIAIAHLWLLEESQQYRDELLEELVITDWDDRVMQFLTALHQRSLVARIGDASDVDAIMQDSNLIPGRQ